MDPIAQIISRINNCISVRKRIMRIASSKLKIKLVKMFKTMGYLKRVTLIKRNNYKSDLILEFNSFGGRMAIEHVKQVSKPGCRIY